MEVSALSHARIRMIPLYQLNYVGKTNLLTRNSADINICFSF